VTAASVANWIAAVQAHYQPRSLHVLRSALSWYVSRDCRGGELPTRDERIKMLITGVEKQRARAAAAAPAAEAAPVTIPLTAELLASLSLVASGAARGSVSIAPREVMLWAAACLGVFGLLRPNELLGKHKDRSGATRADAITFYANDSALPPALPVRLGAWSEARTPDHFSVRLGPTKADPAGRNAPLRIAAPMAVEALWRWMHVRLDWGGTADGPLFALPTASGAPGALKCAELCRAIGSWIALSRGGPPPRITGRCFRKGGATSLVSGGAGLSEILAQGRWRTPAMVGIYSIREALMQRALEANRQMGRPTTAKA